MEANQWSRFSQGSQCVLCYIPCEYMTNTNLCFDAWTVRQIENDDFEQEHWDNDDSDDYEHLDEDSLDDEENNTVIEQFENDRRFIDDVKNFAEKMLRTFVSLTLSNFPEEFLMKISISSALNHRHRTKNIELFIERTFASFSRDSSEFFIFFKNSEGIFLANSLSNTLKRVNRSTETIFLSRTKLLENQ